MAETAPVGMADGSMVRGSWGSHQSLVSVVARAIASGREAAGQLSAGLDIARSRAHERHRPGPSRSSCPNRGARRPQRVAKRLPIPAATRPAPVDSARARRALRYVDGHRSRHHPAEVGNGSPT